MGTKWLKLKAAHDRLLRVWLIGSSAGGVVAYSLLITARMAWGPTDHDWWRIALGPVIGFGFPLGAFWFASRLDIEEARRGEELE